ncbi:MaoC/PaaZ C-terminal domain-containing protein [Bradyrhizobium sp. BWA-3-5]|uniref:MaoC/PaaZ C-terminal domain-containing protein n=1 Tax=Bradyrhizobium sp. BWA-3-5 TaxID=3080013 RepID=UPI00293E0078|nr:MaoC/PaaZ C-terminal domain-containing protein [Bradyrhizobium sp. BWA-3-5]WOH64031.1 MaoC/PaaZ C-terminal domain-containing protein [Bradyrhizobium sp. BWA-3-5]
MTRTFSESEVDAFGYLSGDLDAFGYLSGDLNPLHMDDEFASFGRRVVHGLLTAAVVSRTHAN